MDHELFEMSYKYLRRLCVGHSIKCESLTINCHRVSRHLLHYHIAFFFIMILRPHPYYDLTITSKSAEVYLCRALLHSNAKMNQLKAKYSKSVALHTTDEYRENF